MSQQAETKQKVLITGATGLIGRSLVPLLTSQGYQVYKLQRTVSETEPYWLIDQQEIYLNSAPQPDIIIHLAGENIANARWTETVKQKITDSRIQSTQLIVDFINNSETPPSLFICASAIGFYGNSGQQPVDESSSQGDEFVSQLAAQWEQTSHKVNTNKTRVVNLRTGIVLDKQEGALAKMLPAFRMGVGGKIGQGKQIMSWIDLTDQVNAILFIMRNAELSGPVNLVSPNPVTNRNFSVILANILNRPCILPLPAFMVELLFAEMGKALLLSSTNVRPTKLLEAGFTFQYELLEASLKHQLQRK
ncbi:TIGR01777 family protein [Psychromonas sp. B3M02]|uniref:TIGR01777 family oxidoreductase n=1 Tax=Psychromonas sp. B3M02 TaxID=2267226 RepID=UPI000DEA441E|nr:TIGR01777 family oxidoreductase [Psychromonas sp. B3M02]RBW43983.1 TIGR01777 family protein [Psychromonas sp. B3M02]